MIERITKLIKENNLTNYKVSKDLSFSHRNISDWVAGRVKPSTDAIIKLANYFGVSTDYLLMGQDFVSPVSLLSSQEKKVLEKFNKLDDKQKQVVLDFLDLQLKYSSKTASKEE